MKLLLDQGLPRSTARHLTTRGMSAEHVADIGLKNASDQVILDTARNGSRSL